MRVGEKEGGYRHLQKMDVLEKCDNDTAVVYESLVFQLVSVIKIMRSRERSLSYIKAYYKFISSIQLLILRYCTVGTHAINFAFQFFFSLQHAEGLRVWSVA